MIDVASITATLGRRALPEIQRAPRWSTTPRTAASRPPATPPDTEVSVNAAGYLVSLDFAVLRHIAEERGLQIEVPHDVGTFVSEATVVLRIWGRPLATDEDEERAKRNLRLCFAFGDVQREEQNPMLLRDQPVGIWARALSPGANDPFTAINCVNWMQAGALAAARHEGGLTGRQDGPVRMPELTFADVLDASLGASRPYTATDPLADTHDHVMLDRLETEVGADSPHCDVLRQFLRKMRDMPLPEGADCIQSGAVLRSAVRSSG